MLTRARFGPDAARRPLFGAVALRTPPMPADTDLSSRPMVIRGCCRDHRADRASRPLIDADRGRCIGTRLAGDPGRSRLRVDRNRNSAGGRKPTGCRRADRASAVAASSRLADFAGPRFSRQCDLGRLRQFAGTVDPYPLPRRPPRASSGGNAPPAFRLIGLFARIDQHSQIVAGSQAQPANRLDNGVRGKAQPHPLRQGREA